MSLFLSDFNEAQIFSTYFRKTLKNVLFHENLSSDSGAVPCGETGGQTYRHDEARASFRNFLNAPKKQRK
jgi:hypothetical protein